MLQNLLGTQDSNLRKLQSVIRSKLVIRNNSVLVNGPPEEEVAIRQIFRDLSSMAKRGAIDENGVDAALAIVGLNASEEEAYDSSEGVVVFERSGFTLKTRSKNQRAYVKSANEADLVFAVGPAGTGKTYLAVAIAVKALMKEEVDRIILVRPAVEAGESLGFLPGDLQEKVEPYFRPLYDSLMDMLTPEQLKRFIDQSKVEIAPLAYMRGRTLNNAYVILDEAQNTTSEQLKMFLTRLGSKSKAIVTGDLTQIDLPNKERNGLSEAILLLKNIKGIRFVTLDHTDVVRHKLVREIIQAYDNDKPKKEVRRGGR